MMEEREDEDARLSEEVVESKSKQVRSDGHQANRVSSLLASNIGRQASEWPANLCGFRYHETLSTEPTGRRRSCHLIYSVCLLDNLIVALDWIHTVDSGHRNYPQKYLFVLTWDVRWQAAGTGKRHLSSLIQK